LNPAGDLAKARAHWVNRDTIVWAGADPNAAYRLYHSPAGGIHVETDSGVQGGMFIPLIVVPAGLPQSVLKQFPHLIGATALRISADFCAQIPEVLKGQLVLAKFNGHQPVDATALQIPGVLDDLFYFGGELGARPSGQAVQFRLWAPTAQSVRLFVYDDPAATAPVIYTMTEQPPGTWEALVGNSTWLNQKYYCYEVKVFSREEGKVVTNVVTDPYSFGLSAESLKSFLVDFSSPLAKPAFWRLAPKPSLASPTDIALYELHIRDFSISDQTVPPADRGKYSAFTHFLSRGMLHLWSLADSGLTHVHLLPASDFTSVPELEGQQAVPCIDPSWGPASPLQQAAIIDPEIKDSDGFNWGYDPYHYGVPEGSYSTAPSGVGRIREFREMVESLHLIGLRVVMDVVYNHTATAGQDPFSVLDKVVPGYYYRLDPNGDEYTNTCCCPDTASEHRMFFKLMLDTLKIWVCEYNIDGFRFDLMGFSFVDNLLEIKRALHEIDPAIYLYGEGWDFGEVKGNAMGINASQVNMAGTGIGTFSDRGRDAIRGGGAHDRGEGLIRNQGFINGLWCYDNESPTFAVKECFQKLLEAGDLIKLALAGTLRDYEFINCRGQVVKGAELKYNDQPAGYAKDPPDVINYVSAHDNQTLFDINQYRIPMETTMNDRVRINNLGVALVGLAQGIPFFHAGDDVLRSKSFDRNSYNSGDWFNRLDWSYQTNNFGIGLPPESENGGDWSVMTPFLLNPAIKPGFDAIYSAHLYFREILRIRKSSPLFRLQTGEDAKQRVKFYNVGLSQQPALILMMLSDKTDQILDSRVRSIVVLFNADRIGKTVTVSDCAGMPLDLHPVLRRSIADPIVRESRYDEGTGTFVIPPRTTAVFVEKRPNRCRSYGTDRLF
jgi:pullulanase/glycogen debranching enzyme